jgi:hypothetical protein
VSDAIRRTLSASVPLAQALAKAQAEMLAQAEPFAPEEWELAPGAHALAGPLEIGAEKRVIALVGAAGATLAITGGALTVRGADVRVERLSIAASAGGALALRGEAIAASGLAISGGGVDAEATREASLTDVRVAGVTAQRAIGVRVEAPRVRIAGLAVEQIHQGGGAPAPVDGLDAAGVLVTAFDEIDATSIRVDGVSGDAVAGARLVCAGLGAREGAYVVDLDVRRVAGTSAAAGAILLSGGRLRVRGFDVRDVRGGRASGVLALGSRGIEAQVGRADTILATAGDAVGMRLLGGIEGEAIARDLAVEAIGRPAPAAAGEVGDWQKWAIEARVALLAAAPGRALALPADPAGGAVTGLHLAASLSPFDPAALSAEPPALRLEGATVRRIGGDAIRAEGDLRSAVVRRVEIWAAAAAGHLASELVLGAELTIHAVGKGLSLDPGEARLYNSIVSRVAAGPAFTVDPSSPRPLVGGVYSDVDPNLVPAEDRRVEPLGPLPYRAPGATSFDPSWALGLVPVAEAVDLALEASAKLAARPVPADDGAAARAPFVGAFEPARGGGAGARDPEIRPVPLLATASPSSPIASYTARDAPALLALMLDRARAVMPDWDLGGPADFTTVIFELLAERLDHLAYAQERAVGEGFLDDARRRRSVEELARTLDCPPDPGLSATAMIRFRLDLAAIPESPARAKRSFTVPRDTLVANRATDEESIIFATEEPLAVFPELDLLRLAEDCPAGATSALLAGLPDDLGTGHDGAASGPKPRAAFGGAAAIEDVLRGRWLVIAAKDDPHHAGHVVRVTAVERAPDHVRVRWDPRRPLPVAFAAPPADDGVLREGGDAPVASIYANVVPAHHGVPVARLGPAEQPARGDVLAAWRKLLYLDVEGGPACEVRLPLAPVSVRAPGYPRPGEPPRRGAPAIRVSVEGDEWRVVDDLSLSGPGDEHVVLRPSDDGGAVLRFGDDVSGAALPARSVRIELDLTIGLGKKGNVGAGRLGRILQLGGGGVSDDDGKAWLGDLPEGPERDDLLRALLVADNPLPAAFGRDPEPIEHLRYRAPLGVTDGLSAVTLADYERLAGDLPEVAAAAARVIDAGLRPLVRVTVLLREDDQLDTDERLRRWAVVRRRLEEVRLLGFDVEAVPPEWAPLDLDVVVEAAPHASASAVRDAVAEAVAGEGGMLDPDVAGLGGDVHLSALYQAILAVPGVTGARVTRFQRYEQGAEDRLADGTIPIAPEEVAVVRAPDPTRNGLLTVSVRGGLQ